jgi:hypothetical protein
MRPLATPVIVAFLLLSLATAAGAAEDSAGQDAQQAYPWALSIYGGINGRDTLSDVIGLDADYSDGNDAAVAALAREVYRYETRANLALEGLVGRHCGEDLSHWEFAGLGPARWHPFPWDDIVDTRFAVGAGLSYCTEVSKVEEEYGDDAQRLPGFLAFELTFGYPCWDLMVRRHHRSGMWGLIGESESHYVCVGVKYAFGRPAVQALARSALISSMRSMTPR